MSGIFYLMAKSNDNDWHLVFMLLALFYSILAIYNAFKNN